MKKVTLKVFGPGINCIMVQALDSIHVGANELSEQRRHGDSSVNKSVIIAGGNVSLCMSYRLPYTPASAHV